MTSAIIVGSDGQDGRLLAEELRAAGVAVLGIARASVSSSGLAWTRPVDITRAAEVTEVIGSLRPDAVFHLAALHHSSEETPPDDLEAFRRQYEVNFFSLLNFLEAIRTASTGTRLFFAASSHVFGASAAEVQDETTPRCPDSVYGMTKADGLHACRIYRERHRLFASAGILYTHESPLRDGKFLAMKIARAAQAIRAGSPGDLSVGRLDAVIDWGWAPDVVDAMRRIVRADRAGEFIVATGVPHTVRDFLQVAFESVGLDWRRHVREEPHLVTRPSPVRIGNAARLRAATGWAPTVTFEEMVRRLVSSQAPDAAAPRPGT